MAAGEVFGEVAFFTEVTQHEGIRSTSVCRVLTIPRAGYNTIAQTFPIGSRNVLDNLQAKAQQVMSRQACTAFDPRRPFGCHDEMHHMLCMCSCLHIELRLLDLEPWLLTSSTLPGCRLWACA